LEDFKMQEQMMQPQYEEQPMPYQPVIQSGHSTEGSLRYQLDVNEIIDELEHNIRGETLGIDENTKKPAWYVPKGITPSINRIGVNSVITSLRSRLTKIFILSDFEERDIEEITCSVGEDVIDDFYYNWSKYQIKDTAAASMILHLITDTVYATLRKGFRGNYLKFLKSTHSIHETQHQTLNQSPAGAERSSLNPLAFIFGRKRRR